MPDAFSVVPRIRQLGGAKTTLTVLLLLLALISVGAAYLWRDYQEFSNAVIFPDSDKSQHALEFKEGAGLDQLISGLQGSSPNARVGKRWQWQLLLRELKLERKLKAGEYVFSPNDTPRSVLFAIAEGKVVQHRLTIVEGIRFSMLRTQLAKLRALEQSITAMSDEEVLQAIGAEESHPEGLFLADTYQFPKGFSDLELLKTAYWAQKKLLREAWDKRKPDLPYSTPYEALIMASIIEKETGKASERPEIAGVFVRRLRINMRLQTDPTVIYGIGDAYDGNIRRVHLQTDTPYNSYTRAGLPPTPIALPGRAAIVAALNPNDGKALYFVSKGDGSHVFSESLDAHNQAVRTYQLR